MAKLILEFSPDLTGKMLNDFSVDLCVKISDGTNIDHTSLTLSEIGFGLYIATLATVTSDTLLRVSLISDPLIYATGIFSLSDDNIAKENTIRDLILLEQRKSINGAKVYIPLNTTPLNSTIVTNGGKNVKYADGSELVIGS